MLQLEGKRVRGPNGEEGVIQNGQIVVVQPAAPTTQPPPLRMLQPAPPKQPSPQTPVQAQQDVQSLENAELTPINMRFQNEGELRQNFEKMLPVQNYRTVLQPYVAAIRAADNQAGDLDIVYAFGKIMDPGSVVREGEMEMVTGTGAVAERVKGYLASLKGGGRLTPEIRRDLLREIRSRASAAGEAYNQSRQQYRSLATRYGFDPDAIIGPHVGLPFQQEEANYIGRPVRNQDGSLGPPPVTGRPRLGPDEEITFADEPRPPKDPRTEDWRARNEQAFAAFNSAYLNGASEEQLWELSRQGFGPNATPEWRETIKAAVAERERGKPRAFVPGPINAPPQDISDARSPQDEGFLQNIDASVRGIADVATVGLADEIAAMGDTVAGGGTYAENLYRQRGIDKYDAERNFGPRLTGQLVGGFLLPAGKIKSAGQMAKVGAKYGAAYGFGSGEGSIIDRGQNALLGGTAGALGGTALGVAAPLASKAVNALAPKVFGQVPAEAPAVAAAADRLNVPINAADVRPGTRNAFAFLESSAGSAGPIQRNVAAGRDAMAERVGGLATGTGLDDEAAGQIVRNAGERFIERSGGTAKRLYTRAKTLAGDPSIPAPKALETLDTHIAELSQTENSNKGLLSLLNDLRADLSKPLTIDALRGIRTAMRGEIGTRNLTASNADRIVREVLDSASQDIAAGLSGNPAALRAFERADRFYREKQTYIQDVLQRFLGRKDAPLSAEKTIGVLRGMAREKGGDSRRFAEMMRSLDPEERADIAATFAAQLGRRSEAEPFSPLLFLNGARDIGAPARRILFGDDGARAIDDLITLANAKKGTVERLNNSRSGQVSNYRGLLASVIFGAPGGASVAMMAGGSGVTGAVAGAGLVGAGVTLNRALAKAFTYPPFVRLLANAPKTASPAAIDAHIGRMRQMAAKDPNLRSVVEAIEESLLRAVNDNLPRAGTVAASPDERPDNRQ